MMLKKLAVLVLMGAVVACVVPASADVAYISAGDTWKYVNATTATAASVSTVGFEMPGYDDSSWFTGPAPFGNVSGGDFGNASGTVWDAFHDPLLRKTIVLGSPVAMNVDLGVDNGYDFFVNGVHVSGANAEGYTFRWEYSFSIPSSYFVAGPNVIAVALEDHGGLTAFDMQMTGPGQSSVPEPGVVALLIGVGFTGVRFALRRRR